MSTTGGLKSSRLTKQRRQGLEAARSVEALSTTISRRVSGVTAGTHPLYAVLVVKKVEFESYSMEYGGDVVQYAKVGSPIVTIAQHRGHHVEG